MGVPRPRPGVLLRAVHGIGPTPPEREHVGDRLPAGRLFEVTADGLLVWEYVVPYFGGYEEAEVRGLFPAEPNAVFRAYRYAADELPWLEAGR